MTTLFTYVREVPSKFDVVRTNGGRETMGFNLRVYFPLKVYNKIQSV